MAMKPTISAMVCWALLTGAVAHADTGLGRLHSFKDWVVGCDNTRQCEAQGYSSEAEGAPPGNPAALVATREAGPGRPPRLRFVYGQFCLLYTSRCV